MTQKQTLKIGDVVKVRQGFKDPDTEIDMSSWYGRITQFYPKHDTALIAFDTTTLQNLPENYIEESEIAGVSWSEYGYDLSDLIKVDPRDTVDEAKKMLEQVGEALVHNYLSFGEEGREIRDILRTVDPDGELDALGAWLEYLEQALKFPLEAVVDEWVRGPLRSGDKVRIHAIEAADEHYGIIVKLRRGRKQFHAPLFQLAAANKNSREYNLIDLYRTWFANS